MIKRSPRKKCTEKEIDNIVSMYQDGYGSTFIAPLFNISSGTIFNYLKIRKIEIRSLREFSRDFKKYKFDISFFEKLSSELAYFYGFCLGDGSLGLTKKNSYLRIRLNNRDRIVLEKFVNNMNADSEIIKDRQNTSELRINHSFLKKDLSMWGLVICKTYNPVIPDVPHNLLRYFLIGLIDADGTVKFEKNKGYKISIVGHKLIMKWFVNSIKDLGYKGKITVYDKYSKIWDRVHINIKQDVIDLAKILQVDTCDFLLDRKWHNIKDFLQNEV